MFSFHQALGLTSFPAMVPFVAFVSAGQVGRAPFQGQRMRPSLCQDSARRWQRPGRRPYLMSAAESASDKRRLPCHVTAEVGRAAMSRAVEAAGGDVLGVARECAGGFVDAFTQCYNEEEAANVFVVVGPGITGLIGFYAACMLKEKGFAPAVYFSKPSRYIDLALSCKDAGIDAYDFVPSTLEFYFDVVIDALLGVGFDGGDVRPEFWTIFEMLISTRLAIASVDVPSGWDLETGPRAIDVTADTFIKPELLVSMGVPKMCAKMFAGGFHFIAGRHLPEGYLDSIGVSVPSYPGKDSSSVMFTSNPFRYQGDNGEAYGRPGLYNATLFSKNPTREWVDVENDPELWDELD